jgi:hypothetical protein
LAEIFLDSSAKEARGEVDRDLFEESWKINHD